MLEHLLQDCPSDPPDDESLSMMSEEDVVSFGVVPAPPDQPTPASDSLSPWTCQICLDEQPLGAVPLSSLCGASQCDSIFCSECVKAYCEVAVKDSRFSVLPMRCPAQACGRRVCTSRWTSIVSPATLSSYHEAAQAMFTVRCPECDDPHSFFVGEREESQREDVLKKLRFAKNFKVLSAHWSRFAVGEGSAVAVLDALLEVLEKKTYNFEYLEEFLSLVQDVERRCVLQLAVLREQPKLYTRCCQAAVCWKCKISGHHTGITCEEVQRSELEVEVQFCGECGVATQKTEGCNSMMCLCGAQWEWVGEDLGLHFDDEEE